MKYFSLFSGIGGFELGMPESWECVGYSEINKYAIKIYEKHFNHKAYGDITQIKAEEIPDFDLLCGGFPCQSFSVAGKRGGFSDTRGTLFFEIARISEQKQPRLLLLENVKGLLSHDKGKTFRIILNTLDELGYDLQWQVLNSKDFGVPQNRERVFIVGHLRGTPRPEVFPIGKTEGAINQRHRKKDSMIEIAQTIRQRYGNGSGSHILRQPLRYLNRNQRNYEGDYAFTVDASQTSGIRVGDEIRRFTPLECERLQGFPDGWTKGISDAQRYKCIGNAVTVNVIKAIIDQLI